MATSFFGGAFFSGEFFNVATTTPTGGGGAGGVAKWPGRSSFTWEKWRRKEEQRLQREKDAAEKRVARLQRQIQKARLQLTKQVDLEAIKRLMLEIEAIQTRLDRAQKALDELEMEEVMLIYAITR